MASLTRKKWTVKVKIVFILSSNYPVTTQINLGAEIDAEIKNGERQEVPVRKIEGLSLPYLLVTMDSGTLCDLNGKPRMTRVYYVCFLAGKHEIFSLEEASSCEYEIVVLTPHLCQHPDYRLFSDTISDILYSLLTIHLLYRAKESEENKINCWAVEGSPKKPSSLLDIETESLMLQQQQNLLVFKRILDDL